MTTFADNPAQMLREAASLLRSRAKAASSWDGFWSVHPKRPGRVLEVKGDEWDDAIVASCIDYGGSENGGEKAQHIAALDPAVALALADWLDTAAVDLWAHGPLCECGSGCHECDDSLWQPHVRRALTLARTYLRSDR